MVVDASSLPTGVYIIQNVRNHNWAIVLNADDNSDVIAGTDADEEAGEKWYIRRLSNGAYHLKNELYKTYASYNPTHNANNKATVLNIRTGTPQQWHLQFSEDAYLISDFMNRYWTLRLDHPHTPISLEQYVHNEGQRWRITRPSMNEVVGHLALDNVGVQRHNAIPDGLKDSPSEIGTSVEMQVIAAVPEMSTLNQMVRGVGLGFSEKVSATVSSNFLNSPPTELKSRDEEIVTKRIQLIKLKLSPKVESLPPMDPQCHPGTRKAILNELDCWLPDHGTRLLRTTPSVYWMTGVAGCGKSTISRSLVEMAKNRMMCSWFFFSRDHEERKTCRTLMTTIAHDLASCGDSEVIQRVYDAVEKRVDSSPIRTQMQEFLYRPLEHARRPLLLIWDALDECIGGDDRKFLCELVESLHELPASVWIYITSRPEADFERARHDLSQKISIKHRELTFKHGAHDELTLQDIDIYVRHRFIDVRKKLKLPSSWPGNDAFEKLNNMIGGLFVVAFFLCRFIDHYRGQDRLARLLEASSYIGEDRDYYYYHRGLDHLFKDDKGQEVSDRQGVIGTILVAQYPLQMQVLARLGGVTQIVAMNIIEQLQPFLVADGEHSVTGERTSGPWRFMHKSLSDFLTSPAAGEFRIDVAHASAVLAIPCLAILCSELKAAFAQCDKTSSSSVPNEEGGRNACLPNISEELKYACRFWGYHLKDVTNMDKDLESLLDDFFSCRLLEWLHIMGRFCWLNDAVSCLQCVEKCKLGVVKPEQAELAHDGTRFIHAFRFPLMTFENTNCHMLYFTPTGTRLYQTYALRDSSRILSGLPNSWSPMLMTLEGRESRVASVVFSQDGKRIVSGSQDGTVRVWDALTGQQVGFPLVGHASSVRSVMFSQDGKRIVSGSNDQTVRVWDALTGQQVGSPLVGHRVSVISVAFSQDGKRIVSGSNDKTVRVWDALTGQQVGSYLLGHTYSVTSVAFSQDGQRIVWGSHDNAVRVWDALTGAQMGSPLVGHTYSVTSVAFSQDGKRVVWGAHDNAVRVWDALTGAQVVSPLVGHTDSVTSFAFSQDGKRIVSGSYDKTVRVWDTLTGQQVGSPLVGHTDSVTSVAFFQDGKRIVSGSDDKTIRLWDALTGQQVGSPLVGYSFNARLAAFSQDGKRIVWGHDNAVRVWDASTGEQVVSHFVGHAYCVTSVAFSQDGKRIVSGSYKTMRVWDALAGQQVGPPLAGHTDSVTSVAFSQDGKRIVSESPDGTVQIWDALTGQQVGLHLVENTDDVAPVAFSRNGRCTILGSFDKTERIWDSSTGEMLTTPSGQHKQKIPSLLPDGWFHKIIWLPTNNRGLTAWSEKTQTFATFNERGQFTLIRLA